MEHAGVSELYFQIDPRKHQFATDWIDSDVTECNRLHAHHLSVG